MAGKVKFLTDGRRHLGYCRNYGKSVSETWFWVPVQNSVQSCKKMTDLRPFNWISKWLPRHLRFCRKSSLMANLIPERDCESLCKILCIYVQKWQSCGHLTTFQNGSLRHLGLCRMQILRQTCFRDPIFSLCVKFGANTCNSVWVLEKMYLKNHEVTIMTSSGHVTSLGACPIDSP